MKMETDEKQKKNTNDSHILYILITDIANIDEIFELHTDE